jgi:hypothetical protein
MYVFVYNNFVSLKIESRWLENIVWGGGGAVPCTLVSACMQKSLEILHFLVFVSFLIYLNSPSPPPRVMRATWTIKMSNFIFWKIIKGGS